MAIRRILTIENDRERAILRARAKKVTRFDASIEKLVADMWETMRDAPGVGLAAPQIGQSLRVLVAEYEDQQVAFVNPEIVKMSGEELATEGCLSIPGYVGDNVPRATWVVVKGRDPKGKEIRLRAEGWFARVLQHEIDHLNGVLYIDHIDPKDVREVTEDDLPEEGAPAHAEQRQADTSGAATETTAETSAQPAATSAAATTSGPSGGRR